MQRFWKIGPGLRSLGLTSAWIVAAAGPARPAEPARYAGIEVGSKGVKAVVVEAGSPTNLMEAIANTTISEGVAKSGVFAPEAIADTADVVGKFAGRIKDEFHVPADKIVLIGSSGLPKATNREALVKAATGAAGVASMSFITADDEVKYSIKGLLADESDRAGALLVDVGSGNTKGGFLTPTGVLGFSIPFGSVTFENRVAADAAKGDKTFAEAADRLGTSELAPSLEKQVAAHPELADRQIVILSGGAAYAMATLLKPGALLDKTVDFTAADIAAYADLVRKPKIEVADPSAIAGTPAEKEVRKLLDTFTPTNLIAGSEILSVLTTTLKLDGKTLRFDRRGVLALIRGKVLEQVESEAKAVVDSRAGETQQQQSESKKASTEEETLHEVKKPPMPPAPPKSLPEASGPKASA